MASERYWRRYVAVFTANGTADGTIVVGDVLGFKVKACVIVQSTSQGPLTLEIKSIPNRTTILVGPPGPSMDTRTNLSLYLVADAATITQPKQKRPSIGPGEIDRAVYEEEPVVARRVTVVDPYGDKIDSVRDADGVNRFCVDANIEVSLDNAEINVDFPDKVKITNIPVPLANTEMSHILIAKSERFAIKVRDGEASTRLAFVAGETATNYTKINRGVVFDCGSMDLVLPVTIYFRTDKPGVIVEVINWYFS